MQAKLTHKFKQEYRHKFSYKIRHNCTRSIGYLSIFQYISHKKRRKKNENVKKYYAQMNYKCVKKLGRDSTLSFTCQDDVIKYTRITA